MSKDLKKKYVAHFRFSTQTGIETWAHVSAYYSCDADTTIGEIMQWANSRAVEVPISLEISEIEGQDVKKTRK